MQLPEAFIARTQPLLGAEWPAFERAMHDAPPVCIRWNPAKGTWPAALADNDPVPWASHACYLPARPSFTLDPLFHAGCYYVQEASSMYLEQVVRQQVAGPVRALDLCAAPGGKSTQLLAVLPEGSLLVANEAIRARASVLVENLTKWGGAGKIITRNDPAEWAFFAGFFDLLVADVPCSGEGMFRKEAAAVREWSPAHVRLCAERQKRIIADSWPSLRPGGVLIYSTCTYNREENEENLAWICRTLGAEIVEAPRRFFPHRDRGEGFFMAALQKSSLPGNRQAFRAPKIPAIADPIAKREKARLQHPEKITVLPDAGRLLAFPTAYTADYFFLKQHLNILSAGITLGEQKGRDWIPAHALAVSGALAAGAFPRWAADRDEALRYLRREALPCLPPDLPLGYLMITYGGHPLGFIKNIGSRANNLYPSAWRIRM
jgi:16S rRNA C967 or C1407 C5-methylase (RsmB/RsmF family)/NOL1/NOP2/fmu family ribosome biogenesis protein